MLDINFNNFNKPRQGSLLIAEPFTDDDYFRRSVVLLCEHNEKGSFGFVLNNYIDLDFNELSQDILSIDTPVSVGGPVDINNMYYLHTFKDVPDSIKVTDDIYLGGDYPFLIKKLKDCEFPENHARFFLGYSGWGRMQLEEEIIGKSWAVLNGSIHGLIMDTDQNDLWKKSLGKLGHKFKLFRNFPINPNDN